MNHFRRRNGQLCAEAISLATLADEHGTPTYVYSAATIRRHIHVLQTSLRRINALICYAVKANPNLAILELVAAAGCGFDAVSVGELARVLKAGGDPAGTILSGVGKRNDEIDAGLSAGVQYIGVESTNELAAVAARANHLGVTARVAVRVNPNVDPKTHPHIATGLKKNKFGIPLRLAPELFAQYRGDPRVAMVGVGCHIGSQITSVNPFLQAARRTATLAKGLRTAGAPLEFLGLGGGLGVPYLAETPPSPDQYGAVLAAAVKDVGLRVVLEPGRVIVANAGVLLSRVTRVKPGPKHDFAILDAGMTELIRPALYGARHAIEPVAPLRRAKTKMTIVGPVCESADTFAEAVETPRLKEGDLVAIRGAGAYGFTMASTYNGRPRVAEILCDQTNARLIRARESVTDLWRGEFFLDGSSADATWPISLRRKRK